ncbi:MAG: phosphogluconate dehydrogenase (NAD(+)-dependent, decarboxylating) [Candidatus Bipolaricaulota bacterium]
MNHAVVGLGRMGSGIARRAARAGFHVVVTNRSPDVSIRLASEVRGIEPATDLEDVMARLPSPRCVWLMLPAGEPTDAATTHLGPLLSPGDVVVDGGNSFYRDSQARHAALAARGVGFVDVGTSGGVAGESQGYCLMVGGRKEDVDPLSPWFDALAAGGRLGWRRVGPSGAGHFVKMVHNGIEYGLMQAYAEGFALLRKKREFDLDLRSIADLWGRGSVVRSWLLELVVGALSRDPALSSVAPWVADSGEGRWTVAEAIAADVAAPIITGALLTRIASRDGEDFAARLVAALRGEFGGHEVRQDTSD